MLGRFGKRLLDFVHIAIASLWLGSFAVITGLFATQGAGVPGLDPSSLPLFVYALRERFIVPCIPLLMGTGFIYGLFTRWGFVKHGWVAAKWLLSIFVVVGSAVFPCALWSSALLLAAVLVLFALSVFKPTRRKRAA